MKINIAYLYYDLMNLYGERGNINALSHALETQNIETNIDKLSICDDIDFDKYDVFIMGSGTDNNQKIVLDHIAKYKDKIKDMIEKGKYFLCTGNSLELFGKTIKYDNETYEGLNIFEFDTVKLDKRLVSESLFKSSYVDNYILGFQNQSGEIKNFDFNLFDVLEGVGSFSESTKEGIHYKNFFGTYLIGPILVRNPYFLKKLVMEIISQKDNEYNFSEFDLDLNINAYETFIKNYYPTYYDELSNNKS